MKYKNPFSQLVIIGIFLITINSCKKEDHALLPEVTSYEIINDSEFSATGRGTVISDGGAFVTERGICWSTNQMPTINDKLTIEGTGIGDFTSKLTELTQGTTYYARAYATNRKGTVYGETVSFVAGTATDVTGNLYNMVTIGTQIWMRENLKTTKYRNGDSIPTITDGLEWSALKKGAQCNYNNDAAIGTKYGKLYNWYAVYESRNIAPTGWHVATDAEWTTLTNYVAANFGNSGSVAKALAANTDWEYSINARAVGNDLTKNNSSGFTALPGGLRSIFGPYENIGNNSTWWTSTESSTGVAWYRDMNSESASIFRDVNKVYGFSVRCVKD